MLKNPVIHHTSKNRNLGLDFGFVYIKHEQFPFLLLYVKHDGKFEILRI
ncbi:transposase [Bacillus thuringiensis serovar wratislaviensis]|nr:transposase [Bacillus thuringiensis serovar wratislaviensis]